MPATIHLQLVAAGGDGVPYPADAFAAQFTALLRALTETARHFVGREAEALRYGIARLSTNSPLFAEIVPEPPPFAEKSFEMETIHAELVGGMMGITAQREPPPCINYQVLEQLKILTRPIGEGARGGYLATDYLQCSLNYNLKENLDQIRTEDYVERGGQAKGVVEQMNIHGKRRVFTLYPAHGAERVRCHFPSRLLAEVTGCMGRRVNVTGEVHYRWREKWPYAVKVEEIRPLKDSGDLPKFGDLWGIAPDATGAVPSEDFVRRLRDGQE